MLQGNIDSLCDKIVNPNRLVMSHHQGNIQSL